MAELPDAAPAGRRGAAVSHHRRLGIEIARVMTDNGSCYRSCRLLGVKHIRTKPYTPQTNGKAERFIQTALREWAYANFRFT